MQLLIHSQANKWMTEEQGRRKEAVENMTELLEICAKEVQKFKWKGEEKREICKRKLRFANCPCISVPLHIVGKGCANLILCSELF